VNKRLQEYKRFIDDLVKLRPAVLARWVKERGWPKSPENESFNKLLAELMPEQKEIVAQMVQRGRDGGIHDVLVYLTDEINLNDLRITRNGVELAVEPYGTEMYWDWVCRCEGDNWPKHQLDEEYKDDEA
jgi:hypothetical protein